MDKVVGRIGPAAEITETPSWDGATRCLFVEDTSGRLHFQIVALDDDVDDEFLRDFAQFCTSHMKPRQKRLRDPFRAS